MARTRNLRVTVPLTLALIIGLSGGLVSKAQGDSLPSSGGEVSGVYVPGQSAEFAVSGNYLIVPDESLCPPSVQEQMKASDAWTAIDVRDAYKYAAVTRTYFLPELVWTPILARIGKPTFESAVKVGDRYVDNQWKCRVKTTTKYSSIIDERIPSERATVFIAHQTSQSPQAGVLVLERQNFCTRGFKCTIEVANKIYNLRRKEVRKQLACTTYPSGKSVMPTSSFEYPFNYGEVEKRYPYKGDYRGPLFMMGVPWHVDLTWWGMYIGSKDVCLPVPKKQGKYQVKITRKAATQVTPASPAAWRCNNYTGTVYCTYGSLPKTTFNPSSTVTLQVKVGKKSANVIPVKCQGQCRNETWVGQ